MMRGGKYLVGFVMLAAAAAVGASCTAPPEPAIIPPGPPSASTTLPNFGHVVVMVLENTDFDESFGPGGATRAPYLNSLADQYALATDYFGVDHASLTNYIALTSGQTPTSLTKIDCPFYNCVYDASVQHIGDQVEASGRTWMAYMDGMATPCQHGAEGSLDPYIAYIPTLNTYATRHNPWMYYDNVTSNPARCASHDIPYLRFGADLAANALPNFTFISPDLCHDGHESRCGLAAADLWASQEVPKILASPQFQADGVLVITFDEAESSDSTGCCGNSAGGKVGAIVVSPAYGKTGGYRSSVPANHYSLLRTIEDSWGLPLLGHAQDAGVTPMTDLFN
jgi:phosphatidylinositol-3-phosphatase